MHIDQLTKIVISICIKIHNKIGPGCYEKVYEEILYYELTKMGFKVERQILMPIAWEELRVEGAFKLDLLVEDRLIIELKSVNPLPSVFFKQIRTHLSLMDLKYGMLINFKVDMMREGLHRVYNNNGREQM
ncbi:MAG: GxxExxY protein [Ferruginibacter sp.]|nr:GxxExxY protein [Ferruginibacter sp.]